LAEVLAVCDSHTPVSYNRKIALAITYFLCLLRMHIYLSRA
jgi:hypothetical protein